MASSNTIHISLYFKVNNYKAPHSRKNMASLLNKLEHLINFLDMLRFDHVRKSLSGTRNCLKGCS